MASGIPDSPDAPVSAKVSGRVLPFSPLQRHNGCYLMSGSLSESGGRVSHPVKNNTTVCSGKRGGYRKAEAGFNLIEVLIVSGLLMLLASSGFVTLIMMDRSSRRQAETMTAFELAQGKIEELRSTTYAPPTDPFKTTTNVVTNTVSIALNSSGSNATVSATMITTIAPITQGHLITVVLPVTTYGQSRTVQLQSVVNDWTEP